MSRLFKHLRLDRLMCDGLREALRPYSTVPFQASIEFCARLYAALYDLEADPDKESVDFFVDASDVMLINHFVSSEDGDWAKDVLHQTRQALHELVTGKEAVRLASMDETHRLLEGIALDLGNEDGKQLELDSSDQEG